MALLNSGMLLVDFRSLLYPLSLLPDVTELYIRIFKPCLYLTGVAVAKRRLDAVKCAEYEHNIKYVTSVSIIL